MRSDLGLLGFADRAFSLHTRSKRFGFLTKPLGLLGKALFKRCSLLETASFRGADPFRREGRRKRVMAFIDPAGLSYSGM
jgi:hypothetical protein